MLRDLNPPVTGTREDLAFDHSLKIERLVKHFGATMAVNDVSLSAGRGEVVAIVGHNGAGKSTLLRCIGGFVPPTHGSINVGDEQFSALTVRQARALGVRSVRQELSLPTSLSTVECALLLEGKWGTHLRDARRIERTLKELFLEMFERELPNPRELIGKLEFAQRQMLEVCLAFLDHKKVGRIVILDEATSALDAEVAAILLRWVREAAKSHGVTVLISSHRLHELVGIVDRAIVMADGQVVGSAAETEVTEDNLVALMRAAIMARSSELRSIEAENESKVATSWVPPPEEPHSDAITAGTTLIEVANVSVPPRVKSARLTVNAGEIVGVGGLEGQGQTELLRWIFERNAVWRPLKFLRSLQPGQVPGSRAPTMGIVTGDTRREGVFPYWTVCWNTSIAARRSLSKFGFVRGRAERSVVESLLSGLTVRGRSNQNIMELSGGTQQKVVLARALLKRPNILILDDPTRGIDVATKEEIYRLFQQLKSLGVGVLWYSSELNELKLCDRVYVMRSGYTTGELKGREVDAQVLEMSFSRTLEEVNNSSAASRDLTAARPGGFKDGIG